MHREEYELIKDLTGGDADWMEQVGIQNPDDLVEKEETWDPEAEHAFQYSEMKPSPGWPGWIF